MVVVHSCVWGNTGVLPAQTHPVPSQTRVVILAAVAEEPRTGNQFELAIAAATGIDDQNQAIAGGLVLIDFMSSTDGIDTIRAQVERVDIFIADGVPLRAEIACTGDVKLRNGRRFLGVPGTIGVSDKRKQSLYFPEVMLQEIQDAAVFSGGSRIEAFEPESLVVSLGAGSTVESEFQAAAAINAEGQAMGSLSMLAQLDNGDLVRVDGVVDGGGVVGLPNGLPTGKRQHLPPPRILALSGMTAVDVFHSNRPSPDTCFGDFTFVANEGPHGPFRIDIPDCRDPAAGIEGTDVGSAAIAISEMTWPPIDRIRVRSPQ